MIMDIKKLKPQKNSRYKQGMIHPTRLKKLFESQQTKPVIYRSSYEWRFINWLENDNHIVSWGSECVGIPYIFNGERHTYFPDYIVKLDDNRVWLVEIKPENQTKKPTNQNSYAWQQYLKNIAKWRYAINFCKERNIEFKIFTETTINRL